jgi:hypothetical protein
MYDKKFGVRFFLEWQVVEPLVTAPHSFLLGPHGQPARLHASEPGAVHTAVTASRICPLHVSWQRIARFGTANRSH